MTQIKYLLRDSSYQDAYGFFHDRATLRLSTNEYALLVHYWREPEFATPGLFNLRESGSRVRLTSLISGGTLDIFYPCWESGNHLVRKILVSKNKNRTVWNFEIETLNDICGTEDASIHVVHERDDYFFYKY